MTKRGGSGFALAGLVLCGFVAGAPLFAGCPGHRAQAKRGPQIRITTALSTPAPLVLENCAGRVPVEMGRPPTAASPVARLQLEAQPPAPLSVVKAVLADRGRALCAHGVHIEQGMVNAQHELQSAQAVVWRRGTDPYGPIVVPPGQKPALRAMPEPFEPEPFETEPVEPEPVEQPNETPQTETAPAAPAGDAPADPGTPATTDSGAVRPETSTR